MDSSEDISGMDGVFERQRKTIDDKFDATEALNQASITRKNHVKMEKHIVAQIRIAKREEAGKNLTKDQLDDLVYTSEEYANYLKELSLLQLAESEAEGALEKIKDEYETRRQLISFKKSQIQML